MTLDQIIDQLKNNQRLNKNIVHWKTYPPRDAIYEDFPPELDRRIVAALSEKGITQLYSHQARTIQLIQNDRDVVVVTPTASGKTLVYNFTFIEHFWADPDSRALYIFPLKALAQDQLLNFNQK